MQQAREQCWPHHPGVQPTCSTAWIPALHSASLPSVQRRVILTDLVRSEGSVHSRLQA